VHGGALIMRFIASADFTPDRPWDALNLATISPATVRLHWTDSEYVWHRNDGTEVFVVVAGEVDMHYRDGRGDEHVRRLTPGLICVAEIGDEHKAVPIGAASIVVVEQEGSI